MSDKPKTNDNPDGSDSELLRPSCSGQCKAYIRLAMAKIHSGDYYEGMDMLARLVGDPTSTEKTGKIEPRSLILPNAEITRGASTRDVNQTNKAPAGGVE